MMANKKNRITFVFIALCCILLAVAFFVGISGNPLGLFLCYLATAALILAFVHRWRKLKSFLILLGVSLIGFPLFVILHNLFYALAEMTIDIIVLNYSFEFLQVASFLIAIFACPAGFLVSAVGIAAVSFKIAMTKTKMSHE